MSRTRKDAKSTSVARSPWRKRIIWATAFVGIVCGVMVIRHYTSGTASAEPPNSRPGANTPGSASPIIGPSKKTIPDVVAIVNGEDIRRETLERACVLRYGEEVLEAFVNKFLIRSHCKNRGITITDQELDSEIARMAKRLNLGQAQFIQMLERERGININEYRNDTIWAMIALRKLAAKDLVISPEELKKSYDAEFGPSVMVRLIALGTAQKAQEIHTQLIAAPDAFARFAMDHSTDVNSASMGGLIQPIRRNIGDPGVEKAAFDLKEGEISSIIPVGNQFVILKCERHIAARNVPLQQVQEQLVEKLKDERLRGVAAELFGKLQKTATIRNVYNDPTLSQTMPGVVATVNGETISMKELGQECLLRHGEEVLQIEISHLLLQQGLKHNNVTITQDEMNAEVVHAAKLAGQQNSQGNVNMDEWMKMATEDRGITKDLYYKDSVWPSAALKKLTSGKVEVTQDDLKKGYESNYGERVRCRAIVMTDNRKVLRIWELARNCKTAEEFGALATEYSVEPASGALRGEVPPIRRYGGQLALEDAAFSLKPGQISSILQVGDKSVILYCEGRTTPIAVKMEEVQDILYQDIFEKKLRIAMGQKFEELQANARIANYLDGSSHSPEQKGGAQQAAGKSNATAPATRRDAAVQPASRVTQ